MKFSPAYLQETPLFQANGNLPRYHRERLIECIFSIDSFGVLQSAQPVHVSDSAFVRYARTWLSSITFVPTVINDMPAAGQLEGMLQYRAKVRFPEIILPLDQNGSLVDEHLFYQSARHNGIYPPELIKYPTYFCDVKANDTSLIYPYILLHLSLDSSGMLSEIRTVASTLPAFTEQIRSATLWATFEPARVNRHRVSSDCFLLVSFFPQVNYPTRVYQKNETDSVTLLDRLRVRLLPDTLGIMTLPIPRKRDGDALTFSGDHVGFLDTATALIRIDTSGRASAHRIAAANVWTKQGVKTAVSRLRLYPALDFAGKPRSHSGLISFYFSASTSVRMNFHWLHPND